MGYIRDHAIIVTGASDFDTGEPSDELRAAREAAINSGCMLVSECVGPGVNGSMSFFVAPDGSKEGWNPSDEQDEARARFISWLRANGYYNWCEVQTYDDGGMVTICDHGGLEVPDA